MRYSLASRRLAGALAELSALVLLVDHDDGRRCDTDVGCCSPADPDQADVHA